MRNDGVRKQAMGDSFFSYIVKQSISSVLFIKGNVTEEMRQTYSPIAKEHL